SGADALRAAGHAVTRSAIVYRPEGMPPCLPAKAGNTNSAAARPARFSHTWQIGCAANSLSWRSHIRSWMRDGSHSAAAQQRALATETARSRQSISRQAPQISSRDYRAAGSGQGRRSERGDTIGMHHGDEAGQECKAQNQNSKTTQHHTNPSTG